MGQPKDGADGGKPKPDGQDQNHNALGGFVEQINAPGADCQKVCGSKKNAAQLTAVEFDNCYYGQTDQQGRSLQLNTPVTYPGKDGVPKPKLEKITTQGATMDSRRLDVFVHALPAVRPVSFENGANKAAGTAFMISEDGIMATNKHVVDGSTGIVKVKMLKPDGSEEVRNAQVVKVSASQDLALLQVDKRPGETFKWLPLSKVTSWKEREPLVEMGNANGEGKISMARSRYHSMVTQKDIPFDQQPPDVLQERTMYQLDSVVPKGYSGGVVLSVPGSTPDARGHMTRLGTFSVRGITDYSDTTNKAWMIPAARVQFMLDEYRKEQKQ